MKWFKGSSTWINLLVAGTAAVATLAISSWYRYVRETVTRPRAAVLPETRTDPPPPDRSAPSEETSEGAARSEAATDYASWTKAELYERARMLDIRGRSSMNKAELIEALRAHERASAPANRRSMEHP